MIAVNIELTMPIESVTAKPLIGPEPKANSSSAAISVVRLASMIVGQRPAIPRIDGGDRRPARWPISSRIRSKIRTLASTAMPTVSTMPAMPGSVSVALDQRQGCQDQGEIEDQRDIGVRARTGRSSGP